MKVLIADKLSDKTISALKELGAEVSINTELTAEQLPQVIGDNEILIVRSKKVNAAAINAAPALSLIIRAGAGVNTIDLKAASARGVHVANCPGKNTDAVAELAIGLLIAADRRIVAATDDLRAGKWNKKEYGKARGLKDRTLGIIGLGSIGKAVAKRAIGLEMDVIGWSRSLTGAKAEELGIGYCSSPFEAAERADAVTIHLAASRETEHLVGREFLSRMKDGAIVCNSGHFDIELDLVGLKKMSAKLNKNVRPMVDEYIIAGDKRIYVLGEGRLVNLACAHGHPASVMDMSFAVQALTTEWAARSKLPVGVHDVPAAVDEFVSALKLKSMGIKIDKLTPEQKKYLASSESGT